MQIESEGDMVMTRKCLLNDVKNGKKCSFPDGEIASWKK